MNELTFPNVFNVAMRLRLLGAVAQPSKTSPSSKVLRFSGGQTRTHLTEGYFVSFRRENLAGEGHRVLSYAITLHYRDKIRSNLTKIQNIWCLNKHWSICRLAHILSCLGYFLEPTEGARPWQNSEHFNQKTIIYHFSVHFNWFWL